MYVFAIKVILVLLIFSPQGYAEEVGTSVSEEPMALQLQGMFKQLRSEQSKLRLVFKSPDANSIKEKLSAIQKLSDGIISDNLVDRASYKEILPNIVASVSKAIDDITTMVPLLRDLAPKLQNEYVIPFSELQAKSIKLLSCANNDTAQCLDITSWGSEIDKLNNHLYQARSFTATQLEKDKRQIASLMKELKANPNLEAEERLVKKLMRTVSLIQEKISNVLPAFEMKGNLFAGL